MDEQRLIHLPDDENSLGNFADETGSVAKDGESKHFHGTTPPESHTPAATADDRGFVPEVLHYAPLRPVSPAADEAADTPDTPGLKPRPPLVDRFVPGWKTVAVLGTLLALEAIRVLAPMVNEAMTSRPRFTMAASPPEAGAATAPSGTSGPSAWTPIVTPPVETPPAVPADAPAIATAGTGRSAPAPSFLPTPEPAPNRFAPTPPARAALAPPASTSPRPAPATTAPVAPRAPVVEPRATAPPALVSPSAPSAAPAPLPPAVTATTPPTLPADPEPEAARPPASSPRIPAPARPAPPSGGAPSPAAAATAPATVAAPADAAAAAAVIAPVSDETAVRAVLERYRSAYSDLSVNDAKAVWPSVDAKTLTKAFDQLQSQQLHFLDCRVTVAADRASAMCGGQATWVPKVGSRSERSTYREWNFNLRRADGRWLIAGVEMR